MAEAKRDQRELERKRKRENGQGRVNLGLHVYSCPYLRHGITLKLGALKRENTHLESLLMKSICVSECMYRKPGKILRVSCPTCPPSVEDPYEAHLDSAWQFQRHAWQWASAEWSSTPVEALRMCSRSIACLISHLL